MNKRTVFSYSVLAASIFLTLPPVVSAVTPDALTQSTKAELEAPRQFKLEQPGSPGELRNKQQRGFDQTPLQSTGYWVKKGDVLTINADYSGNASPSLEAFISVPHDRTYQYKHAQRQKLNRGLNTVSVTQDGILYIANFSNPIQSDITINLQGGRPFPRFILNKNSKSDWQGMLADPEMKASPYAELLSDRMMITLRRDKAETLIKDGNPVGMLETWDKIVSWAEDQYGLSATESNSLHRRIPHRFHFLDGIPPKGVVNDDACSGALNAWSWRIQSCTENGIKAAVNEQTLRSDGWGPWHELGHHFQMQTQKWDGMTEVTVNLTSLYVQRELGNLPRPEVAGTWDKAVKYFEQAQRNYHEQELHLKAAMLWQLDLTFGKDFYARLGKVYREMPKNEQPASSDAKIQRFILETSRRSGYDLTPCYEKWGLPPAQTTKDHIKQLSLPWMTDPIWENRDSNIKFDYSQAQNVSAPTVTLSRATIDAISTVGTSYSYSVSATTNQQDVTYKWERIAGNDRITARTPDAARTDIVIPAGLTDTEASFRLTATNKAGKTGEALIKVTVSAPQVVVTGDHQMESSKAVVLKAKANFDYNQGNIHYQWSLSKDGHTIPDGISLNGQIKAGLKAGHYLAHVTAELYSGHRRAEMSHHIDITGDDTADNNSWKQEKTYPNPCVKVTYNGKTWLNGWWTVGDKPGTGDEWAVWRELGAKNMHAACK